MRAAVPVSARDAFENLLYEYADGADRSDPAAVARTLHGARFVSPAGDEMEGEAAIRTYLTALFSARTQSTHLLANIRVAMSGDGASATTVAHYQKWVVASEPCLDSIGRYLSKFTLSDGHWQFCEHRVETRWRRPRQTGTE